MSDATRTRSGGLLPHPVLSVVLAVMAGVVTWVMTRMIEASAFAAFPRAFSFPLWPCL